MLTGTESKIMGLLVSGPDISYSIKKIADTIEKPYPLTYNSVKKLLGRKLARKDNHEMILLDYQDNLSEVAYVECLRAKEFIEKNKSLALFVKDVKDALVSDFFIFLMYGSYLKKGKKANDMDIIIILEADSSVELVEKQVHNIATNFSLNLDINVISVKSAYEMLFKRSQFNIMNESVNNHMIFFGAESYYRILKNARQ